MGIETWVMVNNWDFLDRYQVPQFLDKMEEVGVKHLAFGGRLPMKPDARHYSDSPVKGQEPTPEVIAREHEVKALFRATKDRRMEIYLFGTNPRINEVYPEVLPKKHYLDVDLFVKPAEHLGNVCQNGPGFLPYYLGHIRDAHQNFPEADGFLNDGPEFGYEIEPSFMGHISSLFTCFGSCCVKKAKALGYGQDTLIKVAVRLRQNLLSLDSHSLIKTLNQGKESLEFLGAATKEPGVEEWFGFKKDAITGYIRELYQGVKAVDSSLKLGVGSRLPAFTPLTGYHLNDINKYSDFLLPKLYLWMGGYDGLYGTVYRWAKTLKMWNAELSDAMVLRFLYSLFGFMLPSVNCLSDIEQYIDNSCLNNQKVTWVGETFPQAFFQQVVTGQVRKMIRQAGDASRVRPWFNPHHGGRSLTPQELDMALDAAEQGGIQTYMYYCALEDGEWEVAVKHSKGNAHI